MKKFTMIALVLCLGIVCPFIFAACGTQKAESTVMNVSLNPEVEFILDENDTVVSVNALNEEGNLIINGQVFVGKSAEEAVKLFVSISKETGFLVSGNVNVGENEVNISFSGDTKKAENLYKDIKAKVEQYLSEENITATLNKVETLSKEYLQKMVEKCAPYIEKAKVEAMSYKELLDELIASRKETAELYSQELKDAYYRAKADIVNEEKFEYLKSQLSEAQKVAFETINEIYMSAKKSLEETKYSLFVDESSVYQVALKNYRAAKTEFLNYRNYVASLEPNEVTEAVTKTLDAIEAQLKNAEEALNTAYNSAMTSFETAQSTLDKAYNALVNFLAEAGKDVNGALDKIQTNLDTTLTSFEDSFKSKHSEQMQKAQTEWKQMKDKLMEGYKA
ncbi:MAG: hypothetical protein MR024_03775 [Firmicutes bacterium]|nr:hypothetical protein [Bacillota bacterium]